MSCVLVKSGGLCNECAKNSHSQYECAWGTLRVFIDMNDMCEECLDRSHSIIVRAPNSEEESFARYVERRSPFNRRQLRRRQWQQVKDTIRDPYFQLMVIFLIFAAALMISAFVGAWSLTR